MAEPSPTYDLFLLLSTALEQERRAQILGEVEALIGGRGGEIVSKHEWGTRQLAYEIAHTADAEYHLLQFSGPPALLEALDHTLKITDGVTRFRIIKVLRGMPAPPAVSAPAPTQEAAAPEAPAAAEPAEAAEAPAAAEAAAPSA